MENVGSFDSVPIELRNLPQWVLWRYETRGVDSKPTKVPYQRNGTGASSTDPAHWITFEEARSEFSTNPSKFSGIGFVFTNTDPYIGIDFDNCLDENGELVEYFRRAIEELDRFRAYIERSPSGSGLKAFIRSNAPKPAKGRKVVIPEGAGQRIEIYPSGRFFTVTGQAWTAPPVSLDDAQEFFGWFSRCLDAITPQRDHQPREYQQPHTATDYQQQPGRPTPEQRARLYAQATPGAISGQGGHNSTFALTCSLVNGFSLGVDGARPILFEWNNKCDPPWSARELEHKLNQAQQAGDRDGNWGYMLQVDHRDESLDDVNLSGILEQAERSRNGADPLKTRSSTSQPETWGELETSLAGVFTVQELDAFKRKMHSFQDIMLGFKLRDEQLKPIRNSQLPPIIPDPPPGFLADFTQWQLDTAIKPQTNFAIFGAISALSVLVGRKVKLNDSFETRPNIMAVMLGESSSGKDHARRSVEKLFHLSGSSELLLPDPSSDTGLLRKLEEGQNGKLWQADEFGRLLNITKKADSSHLYGIVSELLKLFTSASSPSYKAKAYADKKNNIEITYPYLSVYATATPGQVTKALTPEDIEQGLVGRLFILGGDPKPEYRKAKMIPIPTHLVEFARAWFEFRPGGISPNGGGHEKTIDVSPEADALLDSFSRICNSNASSGEPTAILWARTAEKANKLAMLAACSRTGGPSDQIIVSEADCTWAVVTARVITEWTCALVEDHISENTREADLKKVLQHIRNAGGSGILKGDLTRKTQGMPPRYRDEILRDLVSSGQATEGPTNATTGAKGTRYFSKR